LWRRFASKAAAEVAMRIIGDGVGRNGLKWRGRRFAFVRSFGRVRSRSATFELMRVEICNRRSRYSEQSSDVILGLAKG
jgi:hypothetical protein